MSLGICQHMHSNSGNTLPICSPRITKHSGSHCSTSLSRASTLTQRIIERLRTMLEDAARLEIVGDAARRNQDFYRADRQFDVLKPPHKLMDGLASCLERALASDWGSEWLARPATWPKRRWPRNRCTRLPAHNAERCPRLARNSAAGVRNELQPRNGPVSTL